MLAIHAGFGVSDDMHTQASLMSFDTGMAAFWAQGAVAADVGVDVQLGEVQGDGGHSAAIANRSPTALSACFKLSPACFAYSGFNSNPM